MSLGSRAARFPPTSRHDRGVRLDLADLTDSPLPTWTLIVDINDNGDLLGMWGQ
jgi:hypothetical protein